MRRDVLKVARSRQIAAPADDLKMLRELRSAPYSSSCLPTGAYSTLSTLRRRLIAARAHSLTVTPRPRTRHGSESNRTLTRSAKRRLRD